MSQVTLTLAQARDLARAALVAHATSEENAAHVAEALVAAEADGQQGHGLSRLPSYCAQSRSGKVDGHAAVGIERVAGACVRVDAGGGFAYPALSAAIEALHDLVPSTGLAAAAVWNSHHCGVAGYHVERLAQRGLVAILFANSPQAIAPWGGNAPLFGTNPIAFAAPRAGAQPVVVDASLSKVARGKIMVAAREGRSIPEGWAVDRAGNPTRDAAAALEGSLLPLGDAKGSALVLMVEMLAAALTGANLGFEASSFFSADGPTPAVGQLLLALDPGPLSGGRFGERVETLVAALGVQPGTRLPGARRFELRERAALEGLRIESALHDELQALAR